MSAEAKCPFHHSGSPSRTNRDWWPNQLNLNLLHQHSSLSDPMGKNFNYAEEFKSLDYNGSEKGSCGVDDRLAGLVACGLRPLRSVIYSHGVAQRRNLSHCVTVAEAAVEVSSVSLHSTAGLTT